MIPVPEPRAYVPDLMTDVSLADLTRAVATLHAPPERWAAIATGLSLALEPRLAIATDDQPSRAGPRVRPEPASAEVPARGPASPDDGAPASRRRVMPRPVRSRLIPLAPSQPPVIELRLENALTVSYELARAPAPAPLLTPRAERGILTAMLATAATGGPVDVERAVATIARGEPLDEIPRRMDQTLRRGAHVLLDSSGSMIPFADDVERLERDLISVLGADRIEIARFIGTPLRGAGAGPRFSWEQYRPPERPRPVVVVSDLGAGLSPPDDDRALPWEWQEFAELIRRAGSQLIALTPYRSSRIPVQLRRAFPIVPWNRSVTAFGARRAVRGPIRLTV
jgi:hypothetical protein